MVERQRTKSGVVEEANQDEQSTTNCSWPSKSCKPPRASSFALPNAGLLASEGLCATLEDRDRPEARRRRWELHHVLSSHRARESEIMPSPPQPPPPPLMLVLATNSPFRRNSRPGGLRLSQRLKWHGNNKECPHPRGLVSLIGYPARAERASKQRQSVSQSVRRRSQARIRTTTKLGGSCARQTNQWLAGI